MRWQGIFGLTAALVGMMAGIAGGQQASRGAIYPNSLLPYHQVVLDSQGKLLAVPMVNQWALDGWASIASEETKRANPDIPKRILALSDSKA